MDSSDDQAPPAPPMRPDTVVVAGYGRVVVPSDRASLTVTVSSTETDLRTVMAEASRLVDTTVAVLRELGLADADIDIGSPWVQHSHGGAGTTWVNVQTSLTATFPSLAAAQEALAALQAAGGLSQFQSPTGYLADPEAARRQACEAAFRMAEQRAAEWARLSHATLGRVLAISEVFEVPRGRSSPAALAHHHGRPRGGDIVVEAEVQVTFALVFPQAPDGGVTA
jgi:uncharacterized protein YggE